MGDLVIYHIDMVILDIDMKFGLMILEMTVSIWLSSISIWDILSLCCPVPDPAEFDGRLFDGQVEARSVPRVRAVTLLPFQPELLNQSQHGRAMSGQTHGSERN